MSFITDMWKEVLGRKYITTCGRCGKEVSPSDSRCSHCGTLLSGGDNELEQRAADMVLPTVITCIVFPLRNLPSIVPAAISIQGINPVLEALFDPGFWLVPIDLVLLIVLVRIFWAALRLIRPCISRLPAPFGTIAQWTFYAYVTGVYFAAGGMIAYESSKGSMAWTIGGSLALGVLGIAMAMKELGIDTE